MRLARRGFIFGGAALMSGCATAAVKPPVTLAHGQVPPAPALQVARPPETITAQLNSTRPLDPRGAVRKELLERATAALDIHAGKITQRDRMYLVDFKKFSGEERLYEVDLHGGAVTLMRTSHGRGSDPAHTGFATSFGNTPDSHMSSVGAYATAGASHGAQQGPNVLLDGLEYSNDRARERAIIIHGADYADPAFLAREGKLGRSYGCFSVAHHDLPALRERMGEGRLLFAWA
ncbi:MAG: murein L,D-transpeptidase catalytic domain family protein [Alphaproteobacteria bacterium]|nr:murein L,D-transpeptidase catalytic domain family protein [Alphaproteobacteria bacterium]MBU2270901.1 murein L,D-transpeptidase catalytic domain family protein [Alphaproteobacteria bacterium]MBU2418051.1 murein L,D-transpeptidase catalytic domain family protein [Alphaproteobacteria bacterium]